MSTCEHLVPEEKLQSIQNELIWGLAYRNYNENAKKQPISPVKSPVNIPFEICRAKLRLKHIKKSIIITDEEVEEVKTQKATKKLVKKPEKPTLLDRNVWSQNKYMDFLSLPNPKFYQEPKKKNYKKLCQLEPCPPRFVQLAIPNKRRVYANWKDYSNILPTEMLMRYEEILHTDQNLDPKEARYYYKKLDRQKHKLKKQKKRLAKLKQQAKQKDSGWLKDLIDLLAGDITNYIKDEPLLALNYKQMLLSDGILDRLEQTKMLKKPSRKTKNYYKKTVIEVSDKMAVWIDTLTRFVDVQAIDSVDDIPPVSISSLEEGESEEGESYYESTTDEETGGGWFEKVEGEQELNDDEWLERVEGEEGMGYDDLEAVAQNILKPGQGEGPADLEETLTGLNGDILEKLIRILSKCSDEFLDSLIEENQLPDITYRDVLDRLKELIKKLQPDEGEKSFLEQIMIDWAMQNDPENVNDKVLKKIHEVAAILEGMLAKKAAGDKSEPETSDIDEDKKDEGDTDKEGTGEDEEGAPPKDDDDENKPDKGDEGNEAATEDELLAGDKKDEAADGEEGGLDGGVEEGDAEKAQEGDDAEQAKEGDDAEKAKEGDDADEQAREGADAEQAREGDDAEQVKEGEQAEEDQALDKDKGLLEFPDEESAMGQDDIDKKEAALKDEIENRETEESVQDLDQEVKATTSKDEDQKPDSKTKVKSKQELEAVGVRPESPSTLTGRIIKGHKPQKVVEHSPDTVCCLSLKTWAVWLLEITQNAHNWTQWMSCVIHKIREFASMVRGDIKESDGRVKVLKKAEWRQFTSETEESIVAWRQYSAHVKDLSQTILDSFHGKNVNCCPKCLQDHLITDVVFAHSTLQALTEAINCAAYWQRCLDTLADKACQMVQIRDASEPDLDQKPISSSESDEADLEDVADEASQESGSSVYEIEGVSTKSSLTAVVK